MRYVNVLQDPKGVDAMLLASQGRRVVPVIVEGDGKVVIGFGGT